MKYFRQITNHSKLNIHLDFDVIILWYTHSQAAALPPKFCTFSSKFLELCVWEGTRQFLRKFWISCSLH